MSSRAPRHATAVLRQEVRLGCFEGSTTGQRYLLVLNSRMQSVTLGAHTHMQWSRRPPGYSCQVWLSRSFRTKSPAISAQSRSPAKDAVTVIDSFLRRNSESTYLL